MSTGTLRLIKATANPHGASDSQLFLFVGNPTVAPIREIVPDAGVVAPPPRPDLADCTCCLKILHINDLHGHIARFTPQGDQPILSRIVSHLGYSLAPNIASLRDAGDVELARSLPPGSVHLIVGGHTHHVLNEQGLSVNNIVNGIPIVQAGTLGRFVGEVDVTVRGGETPVLSKAEVPVLSRAEVPVLSKAEVPVLSRAEVPVLSRAEVPVLSRAEVPVLSRAEVPVLSRAEVPVLSRAEVPVLSRAEVAVTNVRLTHTAYQPIDQQFEKENVQPLIEIARPLFTRTLNLPLMDISRVSHLDTSLFLRDELVAYITEHGGVTEEGGAKRDSRLSVIKKPGEPGFVQ